MARARWSHAPGRHGLDRVWTSARDAGDDASTGTGIFGYDMYLTIDYSAKP